MPFIPPTSVIPVVVFCTQERANKQNKEYQHVRLAVFDWVEHEPETKKMHKRMAVE